VKPEDVPKYKGGELLYFPTVAGPITISYNLPDVKTLKLSPDTIAAIFQRDVKTWDAAPIKADNPGVTLPSTAITVVHRSDGSGTTENFTKFLVAAAPSWKLKSGSTVEWPADTEAAAGNQGVASAVKSSSKTGQIGYVDLSDAKAAILQTAQVKNKAGMFVGPTVAGAEAAVAGTTIKDDLTYNPLWADGDKAYPITSPTWILAYKNQTDKAKAEALVGFLRHLLTAGQDLANSIDYAKLPTTLRDKAIAQLDKVVIPAA
jgi:phosphate transport system substrate-binding protein